MKSQLSLFSVLSLIGFAAAFQISFVRQTVSNTQGSFRLNSSTEPNGDFPPEEESEEYTGSVDWDAEWKKVVASEGQMSTGSERPGKSFYKSEAEIAAIKATNKAAEKVVEASSGVANAMPDIRSLSGDWKVSGALRSREA